MNEIARRRASARKGARTRARIANARSTARNMPPGAIGPGPTRTLLSLIVLHQRDHRATVRGLVVETGRRSTREIHQHLHELDQLGLAASLPPGAMRPLVTVTAHTPKEHHR